jgi:hypothetical protein
LEIDFLNNVKEALNHEYPVVIGVELRKSFNKEQMKGTGLWKPTNDEKAEGHHAMCVIGYDDTKFGGSFEVMNSYGADFGDNGFVWIRYADFKKYVKEAYLNEIEGMAPSKCSFGDCANSYSRYSFDNGNIYEGVIEKGIPEIYGSYIYKNGDFYVGGFEKGRKNGNGLFYDALKMEYYSVQFNKDVFISKAEIQGFTTQKELVNINDIYTIFQKVLPGKLVEVDDANFEILKEKFEVPEKALELELK